MELEKHTKDELKNMFNVPKLEIDDSAIENATSILNKDPLFSGIIKTQRSQRKPPLSVNPRTLIMSYNIEALKKNAEISYKFQPLYDLTLEDYYRYFLFHGVFHEGTHILQRNKSNHRLFPYLDLNNIYLIAMDEMQGGSIMDLIVYKLFHNHFFYERNADLNASKLGMEIFEDEDFKLYAETFYLNRLLVSSYSMKGDKVISPVERTMKYLNKKHLMLDNDVPFDIAIEHGLPITLEEYHYIFDFVEEVIRGSKQMDFQEINERMQKLALDREERVKKLALQSKEVSTGN